MTRWSPQQDAALQAVSAWLRKADQPIFRLFGYAGTGKTTLAVHLAGAVKSALFAAFTGKAASVMRSKGCTDASTIHSMIYKPRTDGFGRTEFVLNRDSPAAEADLIVVDECSMVGPDLGRDLMSFGRPILVLGDPAQLPPVDGAGFFTDAEPDFLLTEVHRQAAENPIIRLSIEVREGRELRLGEFGSARVIHRDDLDQRDVLAADQLLVGMNKTRSAYNRRIRTLRGFGGDLPQSTERLVCLRNNSVSGVLNGTIWQVAEAEWGDCPQDSNVPEVKLTLQSTDDEQVVDVTTRIEFLNGGSVKLSKSDYRRIDQFTYGYALTVHKSQGSQWDNVMLFDESGVFREDSHRWLYTGLTRAAERLTIVRS